MRVYVNGIDCGSGRVDKRKTASQRWNDLPDEERQAYTKLVQGCIALVKLHNVEERELAKYLMQYTFIKETKK